MLPVVTAITRIFGLPQYAATWVRPIMEAMRHTRYRWTHSKLGPFLPSEFIRFALRCDSVGRRRSDTRTWVIYRVSDALHREVIAFRQGRGDFPQWLLSPW